MASRPWEPPPHVEYGVSRCLAVCTCRSRGRPPQDARHIVPNKRFCVCCRMAAATDRQGALGARTAAVTLRTWRALQRTMMRRCGCRTFTCQPVQPVPFNDWKSAKFPQLQPCADCMSATLGRRCRHCPMAASSRQPHRKRPQKRGRWGLRGALSRRRLCTRQTAARHSSRWRVQQPCRTCLPRPRSSRRSHSRQARRSISSRRRRSRGQRRHRSMNSPATSSQAVVHSRLRTRCIPHRCVQGCTDSQHHRAESLCASTSSGVNFMDMMGAFRGALAWSSQRLRTHRLQMQRQSCRM
jgi:hypothetical protein